MLVRPCLGAPFEFEGTAASSLLASDTRRRCCPTARRSSQAVLAPPQRSRQRGTLGSGDRHLDGHRQSRQRARWTHGDVAAQRQGARRSRIRRSLSAARNSTIRRPGVDGHRQPRHGTKRAHGELLPNGKVLVAGDWTPTARLSRVSELHDRERHVDGDRHARNRTR